MIDYFDKTLFECPVHSIVQLPDVAGLFTVFQFMDDCVVLKPLRGSTWNFVCSSVNAGILSMRCALSTRVMQVVFEDSMSIDALNLFPDL